MENIKPPRRRDRYPDRDIDCREAIERPFQVLRENIAAAGWGPEETPRRSTILPWPSGWRVTEMARSTQPS